MSDEQTAAEHNAFLVSLLGGEPAPRAAAAAPEETPDFDAGVREPAPEPEDPQRQHDELVAMFTALRNAD